MMVRGFEIRALCVNMKNGSIILDDVHGAGLAASAAG